MKVVFSTARLVIAIYSTVFLSYYAYSAEIKRITAPAEIGLRSTHEICAEFEPAAKLADKKLLISLKDPEDGWHRYGFQSRYLRANSAQKQCLSVTIEVPLPGNTYLWEAKVLLANQPDEDNPLSYLSTPLTVVSDQILMTHVENDTLIPLQTNTINVEVLATQHRDLLIELVDDTGEVYLYKRRELQEGVNQESISIFVPALPEGKTYAWYAKLLPSSGEWSDFLHQTRVLQYTSGEPVLDTLYWPTDTTISLAQYERPFYLALPPSPSSYSRDLSIFEDDELNQSIVVDRLWDTAGTYTRTLNLTTGVIIYQRQSSVFGDSTETVFPPDSTQSQRYRELLQNIRNTAYVIAYQGHRSRQGRELFPYVALDPLIMYLDKILASE